MKRAFFLPLLLALFISGCNKKNAETICDDFLLETPTLTNESDYQIINLILENYYSDYQLINIVQKTDGTSSLEIDYIKTAFERNDIEYDSLSLIDYSEKNICYYYLSDNFPLEAVQLINPQELNCIFSNQDNGWEKYYQKYPESNGYLSFSRPGFNPEGNQAIIEYAWYGGYLAAEGYLVHLEKTGGSWKIAHHLITWIS
jgi:hypothetical protein